MTYDWIAALAFVATLVATTIVGRWLVFRVPALQRTREQNREADRVKLARPRFREAVRVNNRAGLVTNLVFALAILPFCVSLDARPAWRHVVDIEVIKKAGLVPKRVRAVKLICKGELERKLTIKLQGLSAGARTAVEARGGTWEIIPS